MKKMFLFLSLIFFLTIMLIGGNASAAITLGNSPTALPFASELISSTVTTNITNAANALDITSPLGFSIQKGNSKYVRFDLSGSTAIFGAVPTYSIPDDNGTAIVGTLSAGGNGSNYIILEVVAPNTVQYTGISPTQIGTLAAATYTVTGSAASVTVTYTLYGTAGESVTKTNPLSTQTGTMISFSSGISYSQTAVTTNTIDVTNSSTKFVNTYVGDKYHSILGSLKYIIDTTKRKPATGVALVAGDINLFVGATSTLTITGDFTSVRNADGTYTGAALNRVYYDANANDACNTISLAATSVNGTQAVLTNFSAAGIVNTSQLCFVAGGTYEIVAGSYSATFATASAGSNQTYTGISSLAKNGTEIRADFLLTPSGAYANYVRVTNPSTMAGNVYLTLITDTGKTQRMNLGDLSDISGVAQTTSLGALSSSGLININAIYARASVLNPTNFPATGYTQKLRIKAEGEFGTKDNVDIAGVTGGISQGTGITIQCFSQAKSGDSFFMMVK